MSLSKINSVEKSSSSFTAVRSGTFKKTKPVESNQKNTKCLGSSLKERRQTSNDIIELIELKEFLDSINLGKHFNTFLEEEIAFKDLPKLKAEHYKLMGVKIGEQLKIIDELEKLKSSSVERSPIMPLFLPSKVPTINDEDKFAKTFYNLDLRNKKSKSKQIYIEKCVEEKGKTNEKEQEESDNESDNESVKYYNVDELQNDNEGYRYYNVDELENDKQQIDSKLNSTKQDPENDLLDIRESTRYYKTGPKTSYKLFYHNDSYHIDTSRTKDIEPNVKIHWKCDLCNATKTRVACPGRIVSNGFYSPVRIVTEHNHLPDDIKINCVEAVEKIKEQARSTSQAPKNIILDVEQKLDEESSANMPSHRSLQAIISRERKRARSLSVYNGSSKN